MERLRGEKFPGHRLQAFHFSDSLLQPIQRLWEVVKLSALLFCINLVDYAHHSMTLGF